MSPIDPRDDGTHNPPAGHDETWQESWYLFWYDPINAIGGSYHLGLQTPRGKADVWNWTVKGGQEIGHFQSLDLPLPSEDLSDMEVGRMHLRTTTPLTGYDFRTAYPSTGWEVELSYQASTEPFAFGLDGDGVTIGSSHYESFGRVTGTVRGGHSNTAVAGWAFQDHSWGPRDWSSLRSHRWLCATFTEDLFFSVATFVTDEGVRTHGYVHDEGRFHGVAKVAFNARIADDGHTPLGCDVHVWTTTGRGYRVRGTARASATNSHDHGWFATDALCEFELGGRLGTGMLEVAELRALTPALETALSLGHGRVS